MGLLIAVAIASRAHPLSSGSWSASGHTNDVLTVGALGLCAALIVLLAVESRRPGSSARRAWGIADVLFALALLAAVAAAAYGLGRAFHPSTQSHLRGEACVKYERARGRPTSTCKSGRTAPVAKAASHAAKATGSPYRWIGIVAIVVLLGGGGALLVVRGARPTLPLPEGEDDSRETIVAAFDLSLDDLRREPDARRAIIAAYARMETAFAVAGLPRLPSEAPHEFLVRSLGELDASSEAASRLADLFELAKFSRHAPTLTMRDDAISALLVVRDELTARQRPAT